MQSTKTISSNEGWSRKGESDLLNCWNFVVLVDEYEWDRQAIASNDIMLSTKFPSFIFTSSTFDFYLNMFIYLLVF